MNGYSIFVLVVTILYVVYYGYTISKDLYDKKGMSKSDIEEFDISEMGTDFEPQVVSEHEDEESDTEEETSDEVITEPEEEDYDAQVSFPVFTELETAPVTSPGAMDAEQFAEYLALEAESGSNPKVYISQLIDVIPENL